MNRDGWWIPATALLLLISVAAGGWLASLLLPMTLSEVASLVAYLGAVGAVSLVVGVTVVAVTSRLLGPSIVARTLVASAAGLAVPAVGVAILARLMFVNVQHDLPLLVALLVSSGIASAGIVLTVQMDTARRLRALSAAVSDLARAEQASRSEAVAPTPRDDEVAHLSLALEHLERRLREAREERAGIERERTELTTAISNDLRTPLRSIRAEIQAIDDG
ncbi:MAG: hypothetical protein Q7K37_02105, partial [Dehalococcoidia bacterium]|nr:hypothetical protein [Dehalococcoidia bacterium]